MQAMIKPIRTWLIGSDFLLVIIMTTRLCQKKWNCNISIGIVLGALLGVGLIVLMKVKGIGQLLQIAVSYYWTTIIMKYFGVTKNLRGTNEYYFIFAIIVVIITMIHMAQIDDLKS